MASCANRHSVRVIKHLYDSWFRLRNPALEQLGSVSCSIPPGTRNGLYQADTDAEKCCNPRLCCQMLLQTTAAAPARNLGSEWRVMPWLWSGCLHMFFQEWSWWSRASIRSSLLLASTAAGLDWWRHVHIWRFLLLSKYFILTTFCAELEPENTTFCFQRDQVFG